MRHRPWLALVVLAVAAPLLAADRPVFSVTAVWQQAPPPAGGSASVVVTVAVKEGWHVNSNTPLEEFLIPTAVRLELPSGWAADPPVFPAHALRRFAFSERPVAVFEGTFPVLVEVRRGPQSAAAVTLRGVVEAQACNDRVCLAPAEVSFAVDGESGGAALAALPTPPASSVSLPALAEFGTGFTTPSGLSQRFVGGSLLLQLGLVFLAGLALNLTPCVYPLIPITVGYFMSQRGGARARTLLLAIAYVLGISLTYSALGVTAALTGRLFGAALQSPEVVGAIVVVLLALAASMFGVWELRVPTWATRISVGRGGVGGALLMGLGVGVVAAPCIGPFVLGLLTYVGQRQDVFLGFALFFVLSLGLGVPYLLLAVSTRALERLPNSGLWMIGVRQVFGVLLVALAAYFAAPLLPKPLGNGLVAGILLVGGLYLLLVARPGHDHPWIDRFMRVASVAMVVVGVATMPQRSPAAGSELTWQPYEEAAVSAAISSGGPVVLDFFADWCAPCNELDERTFADPQVMRELAGYARFKVDLTRSGQTAEALRQRFAVLGVPTIAFFNGGAEVADERLTGFEPPAEFLARLARVTAR